MSSCRVLRPTVLVLASRFDLSCDYVIAALRQNGCEYLRLNSEDLASFALCLDPCRGHLSCRTKEFRADVDCGQLTGVYFRRPTFLREASQVGRIPEEQFERAQWMAFVRNLMVLDVVKWVNHPTRTYESEHKMIQLKTAAALGFEVAPTWCLNSDRFLAGRFNGDALAVKGLDTVLVRTETSEAFGYTSLLGAEEVMEVDFSGAPMVVQQAITNKIDLRVTVVTDEWWCASVTDKGRGIEGDWRLMKRNACFKEFELPDSVGRRCVALTRELGLHFAAIDLALSRDRYYFLEVNPTGEWAWLQEQIGFPIADRLAGTLQHLTETVS